MKRCIDVTRQLSNSLDQNMLAERINATKSYFNLIIRRTLHTGEQHTIFLTPKVLVVLKAFRLAWRSVKVSDENRELNMWYRLTALAS